MGLTPAEMWRTQPYLRTVVTFLARNIAQLGCTRSSALTRTTASASATAPCRACPGRPNRATTAYELVYGLVADLALYDTAYWLLSDDPDQYVTRLPGRLGDPGGR
jgi:hypothetical protein